MKSGMIQDLQPAHDIDLRREDPVMELSLQTTAAGADVDFTDAHDDPSKLSSRYERASLTRPRKAWFTSRVCFGTPVVAGTVAWPELKGTVSVTDACVSGGNEAVTPEGTVRTVDMVFSAEVVFCKLLGQRIMLGETQFTIVNDFVVDTVVVTMSRCTAARASGLAVVLLDLVKLVPVVVAECVLVGVLEPAQMVGRIVE